MHRSRRRLLLVPVLATIGLGLGLVGTLMRPSPPYSPDPVPPAAAPPTGTAGTAPAPDDAPATEPVQPPPPPEPERFTANAASVAEACDLPVETACSDRACIAMVVGPDLDSPTGWAELVASSPRFVASTALRDLGVPTSALPCGQAISGLVDGRAIRSVELDDGTEVWCTVQGDAAVGLRMCSEQAAASVGLSAARFDDPDLRNLEFDRTEPR